MFLLTDELVINYTCWSNIKPDNAVQLKALLSRDNPVEYEEMLQEQHKLNEFLVEGEIERRQGQGWAINVVVVLLCLFCLVTFVNHIRNGWKQTGNS